MRHALRGRKLKRTSSHKRALMRGLATSLFEHKRIETTEAKAKELRPYAERLITKAKRALAREKQGLLPEGQTIDIHNRRVVAKRIASKAVLQELFDTIAPAVQDRSGGYTRIVKTGLRRGDAGRKAIIELVDWAEPLDGATSTKKKRKAKPSMPQADKTMEEKKKEEEGLTDEEVEGTPEEVSEEIADENVVSEEEPTGTAEDETTEEPEDKAEEAEEQEAKEEEPEAKAVEAGEEEKSEEPEAKSEEKEEGGDKKSE